MFETNFSSIEQQYKKLGDGFNKKRGKNKYTCPMFDNELLASSKRLKLCPRDITFSAKLEEICDYNPRCCISIELVIDGIIIKLFIDIKKETTDSLKKDLFSKIKDNNIYLW